MYSNVYKNKCKQSFATEKIKPILKVFLRLITVVSLGGTDGM